MHAGPVGKGQHARALCVSSNPVLIEDLLRSLSSKFVFHTTSNSLLPQCGQIIGDLKAQCHRDANLKTFVDKFKFT